MIVQQIGEGPYFLYEAYLKDGLLAELAKATNGLAVLLEARYFGYSFPLLTNLSTDNLRFCSVEQIVADQAYFAQNVQFPGLETMNLTAPHTPYIAVGGSLAGALVSILRKGYPDVYWVSLLGGSTRVRPKCNTILASSSATLSSILGKETI